MIKFTLIIWVCSFLGQQTCMQPMEYPILFDTWYECARKAHQESGKILSTMGYKKVNESRIGIKYYCREINTT
jgi:hypothetical protein